MGSGVGHTLVQTLTPTPTCRFSHVKQEMVVQPTVSFCKYSLIEHSRAHSLHFACCCCIFSVADCAL